MMKMYSQLIFLIIFIFSMSSASCAALSGVEDTAQLAYKLALAIQHGQLQIAKDLIDSYPTLPKSSITYSEGKTQTILDFAVVNKNEDIVEYLLEKGATLATTGVTTLHRAVRSGNSEITKIIFNHGKDLLNAQEPKDRYTPLQYAASFDSYNKDVVEYLIDQGAELYPTLLHDVVISFENCNYLIDKIINKSNSLNVQDEGGFTPLMKALLHPQKGNAKYLISKSASALDKEDKLDLTKIDTKNRGNALAWAIYKGNSCDVIESIFDQDPSLLNVLSWKEEEACTPLHQAIGINKKDIINAILKYNPDLSIKDGKGRTPFYQVVLQGDLELAKKLEAQSDIDFNEKDGENMTLLYRCVNGTVSDGSDGRLENSGGYLVLTYDKSIFNKDIFQWLLSQGASLAEQNDSGGETVLHHVVKDILSEKNQDRGNEAFKIMMEKDTYKERIRESLLIANKRGETPLHTLLEESKKNDMVKKLLDVAESGDDEFKKEFKKKVLEKVYSSQTLLHQAVYYGFEESIIKQLLNLGANPLQKDNYGKTPLQNIREKRTLENNSTIAAILEEAEKTAPQPIITPPVENAPSTASSSSSTVAATLSGTSSSQASFGSSKSEPVDQSILAENNNRSQDTTSRRGKEFAAALIGVSLAVAIGYGIKKMITNNNKPTEDREGNVYDEHE